MIWVTLLSDPGLCLSLKATTLRNMITRKVKEANEPIFTCKLTREQLEKLLIKPFDVPKFSNHTQSTERCVKQFTEATAAVIGQDRRDGFVRARLDSRGEIPKQRNRYMYPSRLY